jgi:arylsulfatase A-like enzyme
MLPVLLGRPAARQHDYLYWECHEGGFKQAIRMGQWKGVKTVPGQPLELFDLSQDIGEKENVADKNPEIVSKIEAFLRTARTDSAQWPVKGKSGN